MSNALADIVAGMTVERLSQISGKSVAEIAVYALGGSGVKVSAKTKTTRATNGAGRGSGRKRAGGLRSPAGREEFDARVLAAIEKAGGPVRSEQIAKQVGGSPEQRRAALHRLVAAKKLRSSGQARATTYEAR